MPHKPGNGMTFPSARFEHLGSASSTPVREQLATERHSKATKIFTFTHIISSGRKGSETVMFYFFKKLISLKKSYLKSNIKKLTFRA